MSQLPPSPLPIPSQAPPQAATASPPSLPDTVNKVAPGTGPRYDNTLVKGPENLSAASRDPQLAAQTELSPGTYLNNQTNVQVVSPEDGEARNDEIDPNRDFDAEIAELQRLKAARDAARGTAFTLPADHPPLGPNDKIQGPHDRDNRRPTARELEHGDVIRRTQAVLTSGEHKPHDPPIDRNAPKDRPADPREVARSRGLKFDEKPLNQTTSPATVFAPAEEVTNEV